ncbi:hypothetical protein P22_1260 [Propionispora sp. 2/2-37]|uniref:AmmeMemoRadiSam system radical SAM enzyme n=1 Tax=Propionispora sp. 2/2-37 TaxID=1677858 RepID=UPI0006BB8D32|nr:AmmeMemoRadiSam system radical SAM enzyme [Propionispora sp. 2/2-37]CUH95190.1 hypothetical protein P22_1260 [Propionispora sp. 2/2-37]
MQRALYYRKGTNSVQCLLCPKECKISEGQSGFCRVRQNRQQTLYAQNYGVCSAYALDPVEKKPLFHFFPGRQILSIGTWGCNFTCHFCQNWRIAQEMPELVSLSPYQVAELAFEQTQLGNIGVAYTYSEPVVWYEYVLNTARQVKEHGLKNVMVTNGFINHEPLSQLLPYLDALNIDVKAFTGEFYQTVCGGQLEQVKRTVELAAASCHVEITTLLVPGLNDDESEIEALARWLSDVNPDIPLHISRYFPNYRLHKPPTSAATLEKARQTAGKYLHYVYLGNMGDKGVDTYCPVCGYKVIDRVRRESVLSSDKKCPRCRGSIPISGDVTY